MTRRDRGVDVGWWSACAVQDAKHLHSSGKHLLSSAPFVILSDSEGSHPLDQDASLSLSMTRLICHPERQRRISLALIKMLRFH